MELTTWIFVAISIALYGFGAYIFLQYLLFIWKTMAPRLTNGKLSLQEILSLAAGTAVLGVLLVFGPLYVAKGIQMGWNNFMPVMIDISNGIVQDVQSMLDGTPPVYTYSTNGRTGVQDTGYGTSFGGNIDPITGLPYGVIIDPNTGQVFDDPDAGGGYGPVPTPIMPEMREPTPVPTPTLAPTAIPFDPNDWKPGDPVPTPEG